MKKLFPFKLKELLEDFITFFSQLFWRKAMVAYTNLQQRRKKEESKILRGERDQIKFIDLRFDRW